jgi:hypothetical protein
MEELTPISLRQVSVCPKTTEVCTLAGRMVTGYKLVSTGLHAYERDLQVTTCITLRAESQTNIRS